GIQEGTVRFYGRAAEIDFLSLGWFGFGIRAQWKPAQLDNRRGGVLLRSRKDPIICLSSTSGARQANGERDREYCFHTSLVLPSVIVTYCLVFFQTLRQEHVDGVR